MRYDRQHLWVKLSGPLYRPCGLLPCRLRSFGVNPGGRCLDGPVHPLDLTLGPGVVGLGEPMFDSLLRIRCGRTDGGAA